MHLALGDPDSALAAIDAWTSGPEPVTAVSTHNDELALMLTSAMYARGMRPGTDLAVIGVDNIPLARIAITTVEINIDSYTARVVDRVMHAIEGGGLDSVPAQIEGDDLLRLIVRESA